jgi:hypothetical protein
MAASKNSTNSPGAPSEIAREVLEQHSKRLFILSKHNKHELVNSIMVLNPAYKLLIS